MAQLYSQALRTLIPGSDNQCLKLKSVIDQQIDESQELIVDLATLAGDYVNADIDAYLTKYQDKVVYVIDSQANLDADGDVPVKGIPITDIIKWQLDEIDENGITYEDVLYQISEAKENMVALSMVLEANASAYVNNIASTAMERAQAITGLVNVKLQGASDAAKAAASSLVSKIANTEFSSDAIFNAVSQFMGSARADKEGYISTNLSFDATGCTVWSYLISSVQSGWNNFTAAVDRVIGVIGDAVKSIAQRAIGFTKAAIDVFTGTNDSFSVSGHGDPVIANSGFTYVMESTRKLPQGVIHHTLPGSDIYTYAGSIDDYYTSPGGEKRPFYGLIARRVPRFINPKFVVNWVYYQYSQSAADTDARFTIPDFGGSNDEEYFDKVRKAIQGSVDWVPTTEAEMRDSLVISRGLDVLALTLARYYDTTDIAENAVHTWLTAVPEAGHQYCYSRLLAEASSALSVSSDTNYEEWSTPHQPGYNDMSNKDMVIMAMGGTPTESHWNDPYYWTRRTDAGSLNSRRMVNTCIWGPCFEDYQPDPNRDVFNVIPFIRFPSGRISIINDKQVFAVAFSFIALSVVAAAGAAAAVSTVLIKRKLRDAKIIQAATERDLTKGLMSPDTRKQAVKSVKKAQRKVSTLSILAGAAAGGATALATNVQNIVGSAMNNAVLTSVGNISNNAGVSDADVQPLPTIQDVVNLCNAQQAALLNISDAVQVLTSKITSIKTLIDGKSE